MRKIFTLFIFLICSHLAWANQPITDFSFEFIQNKGQWDKPVLYSTELPQGWLFLEKDRFTYNFLEKEYFNLEHQNESTANRKHKGHAFQVQFLNANPQVKLTTKEKTLAQRNYFIGNDPKKWATDVNAFQEIVYQDLLPKIDLRLYTANQNLKYDYIVAPQGDVSAIKMKYEGVEKLFIKDGRLLIKTTINDIMEERPYAYQIIGGYKKPVACEFTLTNKIVGFKINETYNPNLPLIIDPALVFVTYTGSTNLVSANCATGDELGNAYSGTNAIGGIYPVTPGAYQTIRRGSNIAISKFSPNGSTLLYATYLGGTNSEYPLNLLVNQQNELLVLGSTNSPDFPIQTTSYDRNYSNSQDFFVAKLSSSGNALLASTFLGGNSQEASGLSDQPAALALDKDGNIYVGGSTRSVDFPVTNAYQAKLSGNYDGFVAKFNPNLSQLLWSTYLGGSNLDIIADLKVGASGKVYVTGNTQSADFPTTGTSVNTKFLGAKDGFISVLSAAGSQLVSSTFLGTAQSDMAEILALDPSENIYVIGYTAGTYTQTAGTYGTPNATGGYFIHKLNNALSSTFWSTHIGNASTNTGQPTNLPPIPNGFQVDACGNINFSAFSLINCPTTNDAFSKTRRSLYLGQLSTNAKQLVYGSYFGGLEFGHNHPANQGYISESGALFNIECVTRNEYPIFPGAYSSKKSGNANDGAIAKFQISAFLGSPVKALAETPPVSCFPYTVPFKNNTTNGITYSWNFADGTPESSEVNPQHTFQNPGNYRVRLIAYNPNNCKQADTTFVNISVLEKPVMSFPKVTTYLCEPTVVLDAGNPGYTYLWSTGATTSTITVSQPGDYKVKVMVLNCEEEAKITVAAPLPPVQLPNIFTPNKDGKNDFLVIKNLASDTKLKVFNRWGKLVYQEDNYQNNWEGKNLTQGTYFYYVESPGSCTTQKGWVEINM